MGASWRRLRRVLERLGSILDAPWEVLSTFGRISIDSGSLFAGFVRADGGSQEAVCGEVGRKEPETTGFNNKIHPGGKKTLNNVV